MMIYFTSNFEACAFEIEDPIATVDDSVWDIYCTEPRGTAWDIVDGQFTVLQDPDYLQAKAEAKIRIRELKMELVDTDYMSLKYSEGALSSEEWIPVRDRRTSWRAEINALESEYGLSSK